MSAEGKDKGNKKSILDRELIWETLASDAHTFSDSISFSSSSLTLMGVVRWRMLTTFRKLFSKYSMRSSKLVAVLSKPQTNKVRSCVIIKEIEDGGSTRESFENEWRRKFVCFYNIMVNIHIYMILKCGFYSAFFQAGLYREESGLTREYRICIGN